MYFLGRRSGIRLRAILVNEIYAKSFRRANSSSQGSDGGDEQASLGKIVTLMSVDTERILIFVCYAHQLMISTPFSILIAIGSLFFVLGWSALASILILLITSPLGGYVGKTVSRIEEELMGNTDKRVSIMNEILQGIRVIKYFAWERQFSEKVNKAREQELKSIVKLWGSYIAFGTVGYGGGLVVAFVTFLTYTMFFGHSLDAATAFTAINLLHVVSNLLSFLPHEIMQIYKAKVSLDRIVKFLSEEELEKYLFENPDITEKLSYSSLDTLIQEDNDLDTLHSDEKLPVGFKHAKFIYHGDKSCTSANDRVDSEFSIDETLSAETDSFVATSQGFSLNNLNIEFPIGGLSVICGPTGSGKSSLVLALLGGKTLFTY